MTIFDVRRWATHWRRLFLILLPITIWPWLFGVLSIWALSLTLVIFGIPYLFLRSIWHAET
jgi:hypothetical protein